ncbi:MAG TPA: T9SS type A sorting domain-containing protein [Chitinophagaceae bacterium]|nr:T9SS type A sorting domain-containing protein [Chitinophagaceae bacterium]
MKRFLLFISIILLTTINSKGQSGRDPSPDALQRILKVYPNPATTFTKFEFQKNFGQGYTLQVINFIGKQVFEAKNISSTTTLDLSAYNRGVYIYQLKDQSGRILESGKFQVSK